MNLNYERDRNQLELKKLQEQIRAFEQGNWQLVSKKNEAQTLTGRASPDLEGRDRPLTWESYLKFLAWFKP